MSERELVEALVHAMGHEVKVFDANDPAQMREWAEAERIEREAIQNEGSAPLLVSFTTFEDYHAREKRERALPWDEVVARLKAAKHIYPSKDACPWIKLATFGDVPTSKGSLRHDGNVLAVYGIEGDYDGEAISVPDAATMLAGVGLEAFIYTSPSHTPERPRWRVLCPTSHEFPPPDRRKLVARLNSVLGGALSRESFALSQSYYFGKVAGHVYETQQIRGGRYIDQCDGLPEVYPAINGATHDEGKAHAAPDDLRQIIRTGADGVQHALLSLSARFIAKGMGPADIEAALAELLDACEWRQRDPERWHKRRDSIPRIVADGLKKYGDRRESHANTADSEPEPEPLWRLPDPIGAAEWDSAQTAPLCIVEQYLYADVAVLIAPGGTGKTTLLLHEAVHIVLGLPLYGLEILKPGPVLILTAEDSREMLVARLRCIAAALSLTDDQKARVREGVRISDLCGQAFKLTRIVEDMIVPTLQLDALIAEARALAPVLVDIDPAVSFGVGEMRVNDAEQALIDAARRIRRELGCCARYVHHSGKQNAREKAVDQYAGRGGSSMPDGCRMVAVLQPLKPDEWRTATGVALADGETGMILARPKLSFMPPQPDILLRRHGYAFAHSYRAARTKAEDLALNCAQVLHCLEAEADNKHTQNSLMSQAAAMGISRESVRDAVHTLVARGQVVYEPIMPTPQRGPRAYLRPARCAEAPQ